MQGPFKLTRFLELNYFQMADPLGRNFEEIFPLLVQVWFNAKEIPIRPAVCRKLGNQGFSWGFGIGEIVSR